MSDSKTITVDGEKMDAYGHTKPPDPDYSKPFAECCPRAIPHEQVDTDAQRKQDNRERHSSYRK
jgi:hypothetical protein